MIKQFGKFEWDVKQTFLIIEQISHQHASMSEYGKNFNTISFCYSMT